MAKKITFSCGANAGNPEQPHNKVNFRLSILVDPFGSTDFLLGPYQTKIFWLSKKKVNI